MVNLSPYARVTRIDGSDGTIELPDGQVFPFPWDDIEDYEVGDVFALETGEKADPSVWVENNQIVIVRHVGTRVTADASGRLIDVGNPDNLPLREKMTVRVNAQRNITEIVDDKPIDALKISIADDDFDPTDFITTTSGDGHRWENFGGFADIRSRAMDLVDVHMNKRQKLIDLGVAPVRGVFFAGPAGTGKTFLAKIIAQEAGARLYVVTAGQLGGQLVGQSEGRLERLYEHASSNQDLAVIFFDELDSITKSRGTENGNHGSRLVNTFLNNLDGFHRRDNVITIGTTNRPEDIDSALRRHGRFGYQIYFHNPTQDDRVHVLRAQLHGKKTTGSLPLEHVAALTEGWSSADLNAIWMYAGEHTVKAGRTLIADDHFVMAVEAVELDRQARKAQQKAQQ